MERVKYSNARLIDEAGERMGAVYTEGGVIRYAGEDIGLPYDRLCDVGGHALMPAFIDLHCHLRDPGYPQKETLETGMRAALKGGYATLCAMANTRPVIETAAQVMANHERARALRLCNLFQAAAAGEGLGDKVPTRWAELSKVTPVITNDGLTISDGGFMERLLLASREYGFLISTHCQPERATVRRDLELLRRVGGNLHVGHVSRRETVDMLRTAKGEGLKVTFEITPHHLIGYGMDYKVNPPLRTEADARALIAAIAGGTADCLATDHAPHTAEDKAAGMAGICNIEHAMGIYLWVFMENRIPLARFSQMASANPARLLGLKAGLLREGYAADLTIVDLDYRGSIDPGRMISRSRNTPFEGRPLRGRVLSTIVGGEARYDNGSPVR